MLSIGIKPTEKVLAATVTALGLTGPRLGSRGFYIDPTLGYQEFVYGKAGSAITAAGYACTETTGFVFDMASITTTTPGTAGPGARVAIAMTDLATGDYGWFQVYGKGSLRTLASCAKGTRLNTTGTAGALDDDGTAGSEQILGIVIQTATGGAAATNADAMLNYPAVGITL